MTDREPDNLYDALRDRLADYGQEPPAPLWANIRAQLPPPVAPPQLRRRTRRRAWLALAALLLFVSVGTWQWWQPAGRSAMPAATTLPTANPTPPAGALGPEGRPIAAGPAAPAGARPDAGGPPAPIAAGAGQVATAIAPAAPGSDPAASMSPAAAAGTPAGARGASNTAASATRRAQPAVAATPAARPGQAAGTAATPAATAAAARPGVARSAASRQGWQAAMAATAGHTAAAGARQTPGTSAALARPGVGRPDTTSQQRPAALDNDETAARPATGAGAAFAAAQAATPARVRPETTAAASQVAGAADGVRTGSLMPPAGTGIAGEAAQTAAGGEALALLSPRLVPFGNGAGLGATPAQVPAGPEPAPLPTGRARRWAVQGLAGPAITYRTLGPLPGRTATSPPNAYPGNSTRDVQSTGSPGQERAAAGFGAEAQLRRQLNGRWSLGTGLGYQTFATRQTVTVRVVYSPSVSTVFRPDSVGTLSVRDTYHFLTLPLHVGYQLGSARLRYGLRAGADVALYLGGRSTEGTTTGSTSRSWGISGSPYRSLSLALSLGAEVRYQLAPGWELLAQPTLTHFATSVARPASGYVPRYPLAASALLGVAFWLR